MEKKENRFAFRGSNELGDFIRLMCKSTGWDSSEVIRFGIGYWMMHVKTGVFAAFGESQYSHMLKKINITSRDVIPEGDIKELIGLSSKYARSMELASSDMVPDPSIPEEDIVKDSASLASGPIPVAPPPEKPKPKKPRSGKPKSKKKGSRKKGKKKGKSK